MSSTRGWNISISAFPLVKHSLPRRYKNLVTREPTLSRDTDEYRVAEFSHFQLHHDAEKTREEILSLIAHHVTAVNYIYRDTRFDGRIKHRNIKFEVQRIKVIKRGPVSRQVDKTGLHPV